MIIKSTIVLVTVLAIPVSGGMLKTKLGFLKPYYMAYSSTFGERHIGYYESLKTCLEDKVLYAKEAKKKYKNTKVVCRKTWVGSLSKIGANNAKLNTARENTTMDK